MITIVLLVIKILNVLVGWKTTLGYLNRDNYRNKKRTYKDYIGFIVVTAYNTLYCYTIIKVIISSIIEN